MKNRVFGRQLNRSRKSRRALFRAQTRALAEYGQIKTTLAKAKALQPFVEKIMTLVKKDTLSARRAVLAKLANDKKTTAKLFAYIASVKARNSGFTKIVRLPKRKGDFAQMARFEWVERPVAKKRKIKKENKG